MHTLGFLVITSGLVLLQTTLGLAANVEPDADFLEEALGDGFIVTTKWPTEAKKMQNNNNAVVTNDSTNPEDILSLFQTESVTSEPIATGPEALTKLTSENTNEVSKTENASGSSQTSPWSPEENAEGSADFPDGSGMFSEIFGEKQDKDLQFTTTVRNSADLKTSTLSSEENSGSGMGPEAPISDRLTTTPAMSVVKADNINEIILNKPVDQSDPKSTEKVSFQPKPRLFKEVVPEPDAEVKDGTPGWLLILALCLTVGAVVCVFLGIATKDMWYGPSKRCLNINSTESAKKHKEYDKAATLPMSGKEIVALMGSQKAASKETDYTTINLEEVPEKEYLM